MKLILLILLVIGNSITAKSQENYKISGKSRAYLTAPFC